jgi:hypothetical protein
LKLHALLNLYNDRTFIAAMLESIREIADSLIVVDGAYSQYLEHYKAFVPSAKAWSTDGSLEMIESFKDKPEVQIFRTKDENTCWEKQATKRHFLPNLRLWRHDITQCSPQGHYDVAVTRTVLMHIPPEAIEKTVRHVAKCADRFLIFEYFESIQPVPLAAHNWLHDYVLLFEKENCELIENYARADLPQGLFVFQKKQNI